MTFVSISKMRAAPGKTELCVRRLKQIAEIAAQIGGAGVRLSRVASGDGARDFHFYFACETMQKLSAFGEALSTNADYLKVTAEAEREPSLAYWDGPFVSRVVFGRSQPDFPVMMAREYRIDRRNLKPALDLLPELQALDPSMPVAATIPVIGADMGRLIVSYFAKSSLDLGEKIDRIGMSEAFQAIAVKAAELGALTTSRITVRL